MVEPDNGASQNSSNDHGVLANLPRTRPQRSTPRRAAARGAGSKRAGGSARAAANSSPRKRARSEPTATPKRALTNARAAPVAVAGSKRAPVQGYESDSEATSGSVQPPGAIDLLASAAELVGELAKSGLSRSERLIKDIASRLPLS
jgi:hypothetical protein